MIADITYFSKFLSLDITSLFARQHAVGIRTLLLEIVSCELWTNITSVGGMNIRFYYTWNFFVILSNYDISELDEM